MTQEQRDKLMSELSDFRNRRVYSKNDKWLLYGEEKCTPFEEVKKNYEHYLQYGSTKTAKLLGISIKALMGRFEYYGFEKVYINHNNTQPSEKCMDTLNLTYTQWKKKYNEHSGNYYRSKKRAEKYLAEQK